MPKVKYLTEAALDHGSLSDIRFLDCVLVLHKYPSAAMKISCP